MFAREVYVRRRDLLKARMESGLILLLGNDESPMSFAANSYPFRQDSTFLYYFGLDQPGLAATIDLDEGTECLFGDDPTLDEIVWTGPQPLLRDRSAQIGVARTARGSQLREVLSKAAKQGRVIHLLPQYRPENILKMADYGLQSETRSSALIKSVVQQRSVKSPEEIEQIEEALGVTCQMQITAMKMAQPGVFEYEVA